MSVLVWKNTDSFIFQDIDSFIWSFRYVPIVSIDGFLCLNFSSFAPSLSMVSTSSNIWIDFNVPIIVDFSQFRPSVSFENIAPKINFVKNTFPSVTVDSFKSSVGYGDGVLGGKIEISSNKSNVLFEAGEVGKIDVFAFKSDIVINSVISGVEMLEKKC